MNTEIPMVAEPTAILKLAGDGYTLSVTAETVAHKASLLAAAGAVTEVTDDNQVAVAQFQIRHLAAFRNTVEKSRLEVKRPIIDLGKKIDEAAQSFAGEIVLEETRIKKLVARHAEEVAAEKRRAEAEERRKFEEARKAKEDAERAAAEAQRAQEAAAATSSVSILDAIKAKQAAREAQEAAARAAVEKQVALADRMASSAAVASVRDVAGVRFEPDFEVIDIDKFFSENPTLCDLTVRRRETIAWLKSLRDGGVDIESIEIGLKITLKPVVSTR
jgi:hypothetical protein